MAYGDLVIKQTEGALKVELNGRAYDLLHYECNTFVFIHKEYGIQLPVTFDIDRTSVESLSVPFGLHHKLNGITFKHVTFI